MKFFVEFASQKGFDPLVLDNWKNIRKKELIKQVGRETIILIKIIQIILREEAVCY